MKIKTADNVSAEAVTSQGAKGASIRLLIHQADGAPNFYMRQFDIAPGGCTPLHQHDWEHETYILAGNGVVDSADGEKSIATGDCVFVEPNELHRFRNTGAGELKILCLVPKSSS